MENFKSNEDYMRINLDACVIDIDTTCLEQNTIYSKDIKTTICEIEVKDECNRYSTEQTLPNVNEEIKEEVFNKSVKNYEQIGNENQRKEKGDVQSTSVSTSEQSDHCRSGRSDDNDSDTNYRERASESDSDSSNQWKHLNSKTRRKFASLVLLLVAIGLAISATCVAVVYNSTTLTKFVKGPGGNMLSLSALFIVCILMYTVCCCRQRILRGPCSAVAFFAIVYCETVLTVLLTALVPIESVLIATSMTVAIVVLACIIVGLVKIDFTKYLWIASLALLAVVVCSFLASIIGIFMDVNILHLVICVVAVVVLFVLLMIDIQMVLGGRKRQLEPDMYFFGALLIYMDIMKIFEYILMILIRLSKK